MMPISYGDLECSPHMIARQEAAADHVDPTDERRYELEERLTEIAQEIALQDRRKQSAQNSLTYDEAADEIRQLIVEREWVQSQLMDLDGPGTFDPFDPDRVEDN